jgi:Tfp pilus assembly protein PilV
VGFSLVETIVALVLLQFGMLALAAGAAVAARDLAAARRITLAHALARNRVEGFASLSCPAPQAGIRETNGFIERWRVDSGGGRRLISDSVVFARPNGLTGFVVARRASLCP